MNEIATQDLTKTTLLAPAVSVEEFIAHQEKIKDVVAKALKSNHDFGIIPNTKKPTLLKPGAEKLCSIFNLKAYFNIVESEKDHNFVNEYEDKYNNKRKAVGFYRYVIECILKTPDGTVQGMGLGSCSSLESKYQSRPRDVENTILKMAQKRAHVAATIIVCNLSDRFTQDMEDMKQQPDQQQPRSSGKPAGSQGSNYTITEPQRKRLFAITKSNKDKGWDNLKVKEFMNKAFGFESTKLLGKENYDVLCKTIEAQTFDNALKDLKDFGSNQQPPAEEQPPPPNLDEIPF